MEKLRQNPIYLTLLPVALMFIAFTKLRIPGIKVGPGEAMLAVWILITFIAAVINRAGVTPIVRKTVLMFVVFIGSSIIGSVWSFVSVYSKLDKLPFAFEEVVGTLLIFFMCVAYTLVADKRYTEVTLKIFCILTSIVFYIYYLTHPVTKYRLVIWSDNPNQAALYCFFVSAWSVVFFINTKSLWRIMYLVTLYFSIVVGFATDSDGYKMALYAMSILMVIVFTIKNYRKAFIWIVICGALATVLFFVPDIQLWFLDYFKRLTYENQDTVRYSLWRGAFQAFLNSPLFGNGLMAHAGYDVPFMNYDAHNYPLDMLVRVGTVGFIATVAWFAVLLKPAIKKRKFYDLAIFIAFIVFSMTRVQLRMPVVYVYLLSIYYLNLHEEDKICEIYDKSPKPDHGAYTCKLNSKEFS